MTEHTLPDPNQTPEDVASLYSWANLHGGKYRDFSASRAEMREKARQRVEQTMAEERRHAEQGTDAERAEAVRRQEEQRRSDIAAQQTAHLAAQQAAQRVAEEGAQRAAQQRSQERAQQAAEWGARQAEAAQRAAVPGQAAPGVQPAEWQRARERYPQSPAAVQQEPQPSAPWLPGEEQEEAVRPAWLMPERTEPLTQPAPAPSPSPVDTLQGSRDRMVSRWFALRSVFEDVPAQAVPAPAATRAPVLAIFSLAGGVGKTSLAATLGRVLSARGERVLLVDTAAYGLLPFYFGARDQRPGLLRTFSPPVASGDAPIQMVTLDPETLGAEAAAAEALTAEIQKYARGVSRVVVDLATASGATTRRVMRLLPQILVPLMPDMSSVVSVSSIDAFFEHNGNGNGNGAKSSLPYYVLNQFDPSMPLHLDIREVLREQLGDRLLPFTLRSSPAVSEALAEGMTVMDYAPNSAVAEDYASLAGWVKSLSAPASTSFRGVRWSER